MTIAKPSVRVRSAANAGKRLRWNSIGSAIWPWQLLTLIVFGLLWEYVAANRIIDPLFIGTPSRILSFFFTELFVTGSLASDVLWTLAGTGIAFGLGSLAGIATGLLFVSFPATEKFCDPFFAALNALPRIALAPLFLLWFGLGIGSKIALGFSLTYFIVLSSTVAGARSVDRDFLTLARTLGASRTKIFLRITLVSAVPTLFSGLRLGLIYSLLGVIAGEIIAAQHGLGQQLSYLAGTFQIDGVFAVLLLLALLGSGLTYGMSALESRLIRWR
ncbi:ABC transporter permease [Oceanibacterium hippocampi]|nr:ABC transporter permease [Oceanibacterium hippocampi]